MADKKDTIEPIRGTFEDVVNSIVPKVTKSAPVGGGEEADLALLPLPEIDTLPLGDAVAQGWALEKMPLPGEYRCYDEASDTAEHADLILQITGPGTFASSFGSGDWRLKNNDLVWTSGPLAETWSHVSMHEDCVAISFTSLSRKDTNTDYECRRAGAADRTLAILARLVTPKVGGYTCTDVGDGQQTSFEIRPYR